jgi:hypothetical protein
MGATPSPLRAGIHPYCRAAARRGHSCRRCASPRRRSIGRHAEWRATKSTSAGSTLTRSHEICCREASGEPEDKFRRRVPTVSLRAYLTAVVGGMPQSQHHPQHLRKPWCRAQVRSAWPAQTASRRSWARPSGSPSVGPTSHGTRRASGRRRCGDAA